MPTGKPGTWEHGTESGYRRCGPPKCEDCKKAHWEYNAEHRTAKQGVGRFASTSKKPKAGYCTATTLEELLNAW